jgi:NAD(P)-dependent dehydrogenase (short-subunit alcohol dehydrogenase family)
MAADLADSPVTVNLLLPAGATDTGMVPDDAPAEARERLLDPAIMGPPIVWLASPAAAGVHDERIVASEFGGLMFGARSEQDSSGTSLRASEIRLDQERPPR